MSTTSNTFVINRQKAEIYKDGFAVDPSIIADKSHINMYMHHDGYPDFLGVEIAQWIKHFQAEWGQSYNYSIGTASMSARLVKDFHYNSQYLYPNKKDMNTDYTYIIWCGKEDIWVSIFHNYQIKDKCIFVGTLDKLIDKYKKDDMNYTEWDHEEYASKGY